MCPPIGIRKALDIIAVGVLRERRYGLYRAEAVVGVDDLEVSEVTRFPESGFGELARPHLRRGVLAGRPHVHHLAPPLHHRRVVGEVCEELRRPVTY